MSVNVTIEIRSAHKSVQVHNKIWPDLKLRFLFFASAYNTDNVLVMQP